MNPPGKKTIAIYITEDLKIQDEPRVIVGQMAEIMLGLISNLNEEERANFNTLIQANPLGNRLLTQVIKRYGNK